ncbi:exonuclease domain-containing protein [Rheinheimera texasensis]|uniref:exonuclease domain-containing protein n=1 Tax=Rheinheimera texasensis TaxID=306205 RepID=UPI0006916013|nr:exonuclease domain-containing protein [Rheinheimera texasensis]
MPAPVVLPPDYYLKHFAEFLLRIEAQYAGLLGAVELQFIADFRALQPDAQRLWLRMLSRKGRVFALTDLQYSEISDQRAATMQLLNSGFAARPAQEADLANWLLKANKQQLTDLLQVGLAQGLLAQLPKKSADKATLQQAVTDADLLQPQWLAASGDWLALRQTEPLQYLLFLFFGRIETDLSAFTLRDLGVVATGGLRGSAVSAGSEQSAGEPLYLARFLDVATAQAAYAYARLKAGLREALPRKNSLLTKEQLLQWQQDALSWPEPLDDRTVLVREKLCEALGRQAERLSEPELAIDWYLAGGGYPASERLMRLYHKLGQRDKLDALLTQMQTEPCCDEEFYLAQDFSRRVLKQSRITDTTHLLQQAAVLTLDELWANAPEQGALQYYRQQGYQAEHLENNLWLALFGLLLWPHLFEAADSSIHNEFERRPRDLTTPAFYQRHGAAIEAQLALLDNKAAACRYLLAQSTRHYGKHNAIFSWYPELARPLLALVQAAPAGALAVVLRKMAQDFRRHSSGYPDLMLWRDGESLDEVQELRFIEIKAPGDSVRRNQLSRLRSLRELGFDVRLERVKWVLDPARIYAVIDVETTGGTAGNDRVTEIGLVKLQYGREITRYSTLINPQRRIPAFISKLTGISDAMVATAPVFADIAAELWQQLQGCIFVAHNVRFDYGFIRAEFARCGYQLQLPQLCTVVESRRYFPGLASYSLGNLATHFGIELKQHHRALADAAATAELLLLINERRAVNLSRPEISELLIP